MKASAEKVHHCELQICDSRMLSLRKGGGGHEDYGVCRGLAEHVEAILGEEKLQKLMLDAASLAGQGSAALSGLATQSKALAELEDVVLMPGDDVADCEEVLEVMPGEGMAGHVRPSQTMGLRAPNNLRELSATWDSCFMPCAGHPNPGATYSCLFSTCGGGAAAEQLEV